VRIALCLSVIETVTPKYLTVFMERLSRLAYLQCRLYSISGIEGKYKTSQWNDCCNLQHIMLLQKRLDQLKACMTEFTEQHLRRCEFKQSYVLD
jgi:hypothetical protein